MDPFPKPQDEAQTQIGKEGPWMASDDNFVSFSFVSATGYDKIMSTVHGSPEFVAQNFGLTDFDGKVSTLMKRAIFIDGKFKEWYGESEHAGKA